MIFLKKYLKNKFLSLNEVLRLIVMKMRLKMKNRSHKFYLKKPMPWHGQKHTKYQMSYDNLIISIK